MRRVTTIDHLVLATPDVAETAAFITAATGVTPSVGGPHIGLGTRNVLAALGGDRYLEVVGPDDEQPEPAQPRPFRVDDLAQAALVTWCARSDDLAGVVAGAAAADVRYTDPSPMQRQAPHGLLSWALAFPTFSTCGGAIPFIIDWGATPHPASSSAQGLTLASFLTHRTEPAIDESYRAIGLEEQPTRADGPGPSLTAGIAGPSGVMTLSSDGIEAR